MKLIRTANQKFKVELESGSVIEGAWGEIQAYMLFELEVDKEELDFALETARCASHDTMHFGVNRMFTHSSSATRVRNLVEELKAIQSLRAELRERLIDNPHDMEAIEVMDRLIALYDSLNVRGVIEALDGSQLKAA